MGYKDVNVIVGGNNNNYPQTYKTVILKPSIPLGEQLVDENTIYVVKWDFEIGINKIYSSMDFSQGGTMDIGGVNYYWSRLVSGADNDTINLCDNTVYFCDLNSPVLLPERSITLNKDEAIRLATTRGTYHSRVFYVVEKGINVPNDCVLRFEGGSFNNGFLDLNGCEIIPSYDSIVGEELQIGGFPKTGTSRWDDELGKPLWCNGDAWVDALGNEPNTEYQVVGDNNDDII